MRCRVIGLLLVIVFVPVVAGQERLATPSSTTTITLGEERTIPLRLTNPLDEPDIFELSISSSPAGSISTAMETAGNTTVGAETVQVRIGPGATRTVDLAVRTTSCYSDACTATVTVRGRSLETGTRFVASTDVIVNRNTEVHGAPGLTLPYMLLLLLAAAGITVTRS